MAESNWPVGGACRICDHLLELFDGSREVALGLYG
jgi:hypothetical protein